MNTRFLMLSGSVLLPALFLIQTVAARSVAPDPGADLSAAADSTAVMTLDPTPMSVDSLERIDPMVNELVALRRSAEEGDVVLEVAGFGITLSSSGGQGRGDHSRTRPSRFCLVLLSKTELGYNIPSGVAYDAYPAGTGEFFDLRGSKSTHYSTTLVGLNCKLGRRNRFDITTGLRYTVDNYRLSDNSITLGNPNGMILPVPLEEQADKSKLRITSLGIPLHLSFCPAKYLTVSLNGYFDFTMGANAIYKRPKVKNALSGVNTFRFGLGAGVSYYKVGVYVRYGFTPLFRSGVGPKVHPLSIGLCVDM